MTYLASLPFILRRSTDVFRADALTTTTETVHGLFRLEEDTLVIQWRKRREIEHVGSDEIRTDHEVEEVRETTLPLSAITGGAVRPSFWWWLGVPPRFVLTAADLRVFQEVVGEGGLNLDHPGQLVVRLRRSDRLAAEEFAAELALALAHRPLSSPSEGPGYLEPGEGAQ